jgi:hypothetical protein
MDYRKPDQIAEYLADNGPMSEEDILDDLSVEVEHIDFAERTGMIQGCAPEPGGTGRWYEVPRG